MTASTTYLVSGQPIAMELERQGGFTLLTLTSQNNDTRWMTALQAGAENWATEIQRDFGCTCETELANNQVICTIGGGLEDFAEGLDSLESFLQGSVRENNAMRSGAGVSGGNGGTGTASQEEMVT